MLMCVVLGRHRAGYEDPPAVRILAAGELGIRELGA
jgi:hypothetical protein